MLGLLSSKVLPILPACSRHSVEASSSTHGQAARYDSLSLSAAQSPDLRLWNRVGSRPRPIICSCCEWLARDAAVEFQKRAIPPNRAPESRPEAPLGQKQKLNALSLKKVFEVVPTFVPEADETRHRVIRRHAFRVDAENWVQLE
ncbi:hypothetical protein [Collinsella sp. AF20-14LB]|uniref:hypothetical protein n=1 Tax=Collinsella sp. AF20-14LB TaxID=2292221 RepID=UPI0011C187AC|nr:hypothetical protein [Collinsella sp. AF20-14LB]